MNAQSSLMKIGQHASSLMPAHLQLYLKRTVSMVLEEISKEDCRRGLLQVLGAQVSALKHFDVAANNQTFSWSGG
jgi:hypothetical protein